MITDKELDKLLKKLKPKCDKKILEAVKQEILCLYHQRVRNPLIFRRTKQQLVDPYENTFNDPRDWT